LSSGKFLTRYASTIESKNKLNDCNATTEFDLGYRKGSLRFAVANRFMKLSHCGLDHYLDTDSGIVWKREGDSIIRVESDLSWIDELLATEGNR
jgi:hypothetical protein